MKQYDVTYCTVCYYCSRVWYYGRGLLLTSPQTHSYPSLPEFGVLYIAHFGWLNPEESIRILCIIILIAPTPQHQQHHIIGILNIQYHSHTVPYSSRNVINNIISLVETTIHYTTENSSHRSIFVNNEFLQSFSSKGRWRIHLNGRP